MLSKDFSCSSLHFFDISPSTYEEIFIGSPCAAESSIKAVRNYCSAHYSDIWGQKII